MKLFVYKIFKQPVYRRYINLSVKQSKRLKRLELAVITLRKHGGIFGSRPHIVYQEIYDILLIPHTNESWNLVFEIEWSLPHINLKQHAKKFPLI